MAMSQQAFGRISIGFLAAGFLALLTIAGMSVWLLQRSQTFNDLVMLAQDIEGAAQRVLSLAQDAETGQRGYLITGEETYLEPYTRAAAQVPEAIADFSRLTQHNPAVHAQVLRVDALVKERFAIIDETFDRMRHADPEGAKAIVKSDRGKDVMDRLRAEVASIRGEVARLYAERNANAREVAAWLLEVNFASLAVVALLAVGSVLVTRRYLHDLNAAQAALKTINEGLESMVHERTGEVIRANEEIQRFAYIVSHDLRSPLVNVMGFTSELEEVGTTLRQQQEMIAEKAPDLVLPEASSAIERELPEAISFIRASTAKMDRLINAILKLSRDGRRNLKPERVRMQALAKEIAGSLRHQADEANAEIAVEDVPDIVTDKLAIEQVFSNLIENALKYLDTNRPGRIAVRGRENGLYVEYEIEDNGRGIDTKDHQRVFELFRRAGRQDKPGEGLGLAFVQTIVRRLGGSIALASEAGKGSTFSLKLPKTLRG